MYGALGYAGLLVLTAVLLFADLAGIPFSRLDGGAQIAAAPCRCTKRCV